MRAGRMLIVAALVGLVFSAGACSSKSTPNASPSASAGVTGSAIVFAAASLTQVFTTLAHNFEALHPGTHITLSFGGSSTLATQIVNGAPADVFAAASSKTMDTVVTANAASNPHVFATNIMEIAVPPSNPAHVTRLQDLSRADVKVAVCQPAVPCGVATGKVFVNAGIKVRPVTLEPDVKSVLSKVELDSVDAGMVYVTDVRSATPKVMGIPIPASQNVTTKYPIAVTTQGSSNAVASAFAAYVLSPAATPVLRAAGFGLG